MTRVVVVGLGAWYVSTRLGRGRPLLAAGIGGLAVVAPLIGVAAGSVVMARTRWATAARAKRTRGGDARTVTALADLLTLGLLAGLSLRAAFTEARHHIDGAAASAVDDLIYEMDRVGGAVALASTEGELAGLGRVVAGAAASGAPLATAVAGFAATQRHVDHAARVTAARRLPVRLLLPLALLILPGFVVLAVGPALLQALARLGPTP